MKKTLYLLIFSLFIVFVVSCDKYEIPEEIESIPYQNETGDTVDIPGGDTTGTEVDLLAPFREQVDFYFQDFKQNFIDSVADSVYYREVLKDTTHQFWVIQNSGFIQDYYDAILETDLPADSLKPRFLPNETWDTLVVRYPSFFNGYLDMITISHIGPIEAEDQFNEWCFELIDIVLDDMCDSWIDEYWGLGKPPESLEK